MLKQVGKLLGRGVTTQWAPYSSTSVHLDFINRKYYWDGAERLEADFTTFTGAVFGSGAAAGLTGAGVAGDHDITIAWANLNISAPFVMATVFRPAVLPGTQMHIVNIDAAATPMQNRSTHTVTAASVASAATLVANVTQASQTSGTVLTINTNNAIATLVQTNLFRNSVNGATSGAEDTSGSLPTYANLRFLESGSGTLPFQGAIRHVLFFQNTGGSEISQANLNSLSGELASL